MADLACSICSKPFKEDNVIEINCSDETRERLKARLAQKRYAQQQKRGTRLLDAAKEQHQIGGPEKKRAAIEL